MIEKNNSNKMITILLTIVICLAAIVVLYVNLPADETDEDAEDQGTNDDTTENGDESETVLTLIYGEEQTNYTFEELETMDALTGYGGYRTSYPMINGQATYTGVPVSVLVDLIAGGITNYSLFVVSNEDGLIQNQTYNYTTVQGNINIYNSTNALEETPTEIGNVTMIVCYQKDGEDLDESDDGKLKIVFVNEDEEKITSAFLWWKFVESIEIIQN